MVFMRRRRFIAIHAVVLLLLGAVILLYVRSYSVSDGLIWTTGSARLILRAGEGRIDLFLRTGDWSSERGFQTFHDRPPVALLQAMQEVDEVAWRYDKTLNRIPAWFGMKGAWKNFGAAYVAVHARTSFFACLMMPIWMICIGLCSVPLLRALRVYRRHRLALALLCGECGYNLRGNISGVCPECGAPVPPKSRVLAAAGHTASIVPLRRHLFTAISVVSLLMFVAVLALWVRSYWFADGVSAKTVADGIADAVDDKYEIASVRGRIALRLTQTHPDWLLALALSIPPLIWVRRRRR